MAKKKTVTIFCGSCSKWEYSTHQKTTDNKYFMLKCEPCRYLRIKTAPACGHYEEATIIDINRQEKAQL